MASGVPTGFGLGRWSLPRAAGSADHKARRVLERFRRDLDGLHPRLRRARPAQADHALDGVDLPFKEDLDNSVSAVVCRAGNPFPDRLATNAVAEVHPLHSAEDQQSTPHAFTHVARDLQPVLENEPGARSSCRTGSRRPPGVPLASTRSSNYENVESAGRESTSAACATAHAGQRPRNTISTSTKR
jgi:hypothetical protein